MTPPTPTPRTPNASWALVLSLATALAALAMAAYAADASVVAVGDGGIVRTTPDGVTWTPQTSGTSNNLYGIAHGDGKFVTVGAGGVIRTSGDGVSWSEKCPGGDGTGCVATDLNAVAFSDGVWVAVGDASTILRSVNGKDWTPYAVPDSEGDLFAVANGGGQWIAGGRVPDPCLPFCSSDQTLLLFSADGMTWIENSATGGGVVFKGVAFGATNWVGVGMSSTTATRCFGPLPMTSTSTSNCESNSSALPCNGVARGAGLLVAVCRNHDYTTPDGGAITWTEHSAPTANAVAHDGAQWVAVGPGGKATTNPNPTTTTWTIQDSQTAASLNALAVSPNIPPVDFFNGATFPGAPPGNVAQSTPQGTALTFKTANSNRLTITDPDGIGSQLYRVTFTASTGTVTLASAAGLSFGCLANTPVAGLPACAGTATASTSMTFDGTMDSINAAMDGMTYNPPAGVCGPPAAILTMTMHDEAHSGTGGDLFDTDTVTISITCPPPNVAPTAACSITTAPPYALDQSISFSSSGSSDGDGTITAWSWTFPSGNPASATTASASASWSTPGAYTVSLTVTDDDGATSTAATCSLTVANHAPVANNDDYFVVVGGTLNTFTMGLSSVLAGDTDLDGNLDKVESPLCSGVPAGTGNLDAFTFTGPNAGHFEYSAGAFVGMTTFSYRAQDALNDVSATCATVTLHVSPDAAPTARFTASPNPALVGELVSFVDASYDPDSGDYIAQWEWTFGDGQKSTATNPLHTYGVQGTYPACLVATDSFGSPAPRYCLTLSVLPATGPAPPPPPPPIDGDDDNSGGGGNTDPLDVEADPPRSALEGQAVSMHATVTNAVGAALQWTQTSGPAAALTGAATANAKFTAPALEGPLQVLTFHVVATLGQRTGSTDVFVIVKATNTAPTAQATAAPSVGHGDTVVLDGAGSRDEDGDPLTYKWIQIGGPAVTLERATTSRATFVASSPNAQYAFVLEVSDGIDGDTARVGVASGAVQEQDDETKVPQLQFTVREEADGSYTFTPADTASLFAWEFGDGSPPMMVQGAASHRYDGPGEFMVTMTFEDADGVPHSTQATATVAGERTRDPVEGSDSGSATLLAALAILVGLALVLAVVAFRRRPRRDDMA